MTKNLDELCRAAGLSLEQLSEQCGLELTRTRAIYLGRWTPSPGERRSIATVLQVSIDEIAWGHKTPIQHIYGHGPG